MTELEHVLELQTIDLAIDQVPHRRERLESRQVFKQVTAALTAAEQGLAAAGTRLAAAEHRIEELEAIGATRATKKARLEQQLKTVSSSREADALGAEIANLDRERSESDDEELELLDTVESATADREAAAAEIATLGQSAEAAKAALAADEAELDAELAGLREQRAATAAGLPPALLERYEQLRKSYGGIAISRLAAGRCGACHLDQSRAALDAIKSAPDDAEIECEQCGRLLVR